jgi:hypothetical protein
MLAALQDVAGRNIEITPTNAAIGSLVECGEVTTMNAATFGELRRAFLEQ